MKYLVLFVMILSFLKSTYGQPVLQEGDKAPDFSLQSDDGTWVKLSDYMNKSAVVLYFYPKDFTSGCTKEACNFRDNISDIQSKDAVVLGVSVDDVDSHRKFKEEYKLNYTLLADPNKEVVPKYSGLRDNGYANRVTFVIDKNGIIKKIYPNVDVNENYKEIVEFLKSGEMAK